jgi:hypothetical protein
MATSFRPHVPPTTDENAFRDTGIGFREQMRLRNGMEARPLQPRDHTAKTLNGPAVGASKLTMRPATQEIVFARTSKFARPGTDETRREFAEERQHL